MRNVLIIFTILILGAWKTITPIDADKLWDYANNQAQLELYEEASVNFKECLGLDIAS